MATKWDRLTPGQRLRQFVNPAGPDECWPFSGGANAEGYGYLTVDGRGKRAHRLAWELVHGPIPDGLVVMHMCDNPPCCNPDHLRLGTQRENMRDRNAKGRGNHAHGNDYRNAKLRDELVVEILRRKGRQSGRATGREFGVTHELIRRIWNGTAWPHIDRRAA